MRLRLAFVVLASLASGCDEPIAVDTAPLRQELMKVPFAVDRSTIPEALRRAYQAELGEFLGFLEIQNTYSLLWKSRREFRGDVTFGIDWRERWKALSDRPVDFAARLIDTGRRIQIGATIAALEAQLWVFCLHEEDSASCREAETAAGLSRQSFVELDIPNRIDALIHESHRTETLASLEALRRAALIVLAQAPSFPVRLGSFLVWPRKGSLEADFVDYLRRIQDLYDGVSEDAQGRQQRTTVTTGYEDLDFERLMPVDRLLERTNQVRAYRNSLWWSARSVESPALRALALQLGSRILGSHHCQLRRATAARVLADPLWARQLVRSESPAEWANDLIRGRKDLTRLGEQAQGLAEKRPLLLAEIQALSRLFVEVDFSRKFLAREMAKLGWSNVEVGVRAREALPKVLEGEISDLLSPLSDDCDR